MKHILLILTFCTTAAFSSAASTLYVDDNAPNDPAPGNPLISDPAEDGSQAHPFDAIQQAINAADPNFITEVIILPGTYTGKGNRDIDFKGKAITVRGSDPDDPNVVAATVIDCQGTEAEPHRGFYFHSGETESSVLKGLNITNGYGPTEKDILSQPRSLGGAILCVDSSCKLVGLQIAASTAEYGGAILAVKGAIHLENCTLMSNTAVRIGGGFYFFECSFDIVGCTITKNSAAGRGGGGAVYVYSQGSIRNSTFFQNTAGSGGAFSVFESAVTVEESRICANTAKIAGGGVYLTDSYRSDLRNCLVEGNWSEFSGGGIYVDASMADFFNCTIVGNRANSRAGGILCDDFGYIAVTDSILWANSACDGDQIAFPQYNGELYPRELQVSHSDVQGGRDGIKGMGTRIDWQQGNIDTDPFFADPGLWDGKGTLEPAENTCVKGDYHLKSYAGRWEPALQQWIVDDVHSPCIDAGDTASDYSMEPAYNGGRINMGAYGNTEYASKTPNCPKQPAGDLDGDCKVTFTDFAIFAANWLDCNLEPPIACEQ